MCCGNHCSIYIHYAGIYVGVKTGGVAVLKRSDRYIYYLVSSLFSITTRRCINGTIDALHNS